LNSYFSTKIISIKILLDSKITGGEMKKRSKLWIFILALIILISGVIITCKQSGIGNILAGETGMWGESLFGEHRFGK
jgi:hypothetical protein